MRPKNAEGKRNGKKVLNHDELKKWLSNPKLYAALEEKFGANFTFEILFDDSSLIWDAFKSVLGDGARVKSN